MQEEILERQEDSELQQEQFGCLHMPGLLSETAV